MKIINATNHVMEFNTICSVKIDRGYTVLTSDIFSNI